MSGRLRKARRRARRPRPPALPEVDDLRAALELRAGEWKRTLRGEVAVARVLLRRLIGPLTMADDPADTSAFDEWVTTLTPALLEGLGVAIQDVASQSVPSWNQIHDWLLSLRELRDSGIAA